MKAVVVYELLWGNTAAIARAIAEGIGNGTRALSTLEASSALLEGANLIVAGAPVLGFSLPTEFDAPVDCTKSHPARANPARSFRPVAALLDGSAAERERALRRLRDAHLVVARWIDKSH